MCLALVITDRNTDLLAQKLKRLKPDLNIQVWPNIQRPEDIIIAILWKHPRGILSQFPNLKVVSSLGAGIDFILQDPDLTNEITINRIVTSGLKQQMAQYVLTYVLEDFRQVRNYRKQQENNTWQINELNKKTTIGFLGLGTIGKFVANQCQNLGFTTLAYTNESVDKQIKCVHHETGLRQVMQQSDYIVCLLPLTAATKGLLNAKRLSYCQQKPVLIHAGRGQQLNEGDLIKALDIGLIKHAVLDVFAIEPLAKNNPLWQRKDITITPHNAARSDVEQTALEIVKIVSKI